MDSWLLDALPGFPKRLFGVRRFTDAAAKPALERLRRDDVQFHARGRMSDRPFLHALQLIRAGVLGMEAHLLAAARDRLDGDQTRDASGSRVITRDQRARRIGRIGTIGLATTRTLQPDDQELMEQIAGRGA